MQCFIPRKKINQKTRLNNRAGLKATEINVNLILKETLEKKNYHKMDGQLEKKNSRGQKLQDELSTIGGFRGFHKLKYFHWGPEQKTMC